MFPSQIFLQLFLLLRLSGVQLIEQPQHICSSIDIRTASDFMKFKNCTVIVGHVAITNIDLPPPEQAATEYTKNYEQKSRPEYSMIEEITDYLIVHRVHQLTTLRDLFPHLKLIRGRELLFGEYSLVVHENRNLENLGLVSMLRVQRGKVRIESNPKLCFVGTINWLQLLNNTTQQHFSLEHNKPAQHCPKCTSDASASNLNQSIENLPQLHCWDLDNIQRELPQHIVGRVDSSTESRTDINGNGCCSPHCLDDAATYCSVSKCKLCANFKQNGKCVDSCDVQYYQLNKRDCVTTEECWSKGLIPHAGKCIEECPRNYHQTHNKPNGQTGCNLMCAGTFAVHTLKDLNDLENCVVIRGSLIIELTNSKEKIIEALERALINIKEITGYLKISHSVSLVSLGFLRNLHTIRGEELIDNKYAFFVVDNHHLSELWMETQNVIILNGRIYFHLNPHLCHDKILKLKKSMKSVEKFSEVDASPNSNGERVICGNNIRSLNASIEDFNSTAVRIKVDPISADDKPALLGYLYYYKEAPIKNVTMYDGKHGCGRDNWLMDTSLNLNIRHLLTNLKPAKQYAYFVKTLSKVDYYTPVEAYSKIQYFRTLPAKPGPVSKIYYQSVSSSEVSLHWWPPRKPNGIIKKYIIYYAIVDTELKAEDNHKKYVLDEESIRSPHNDCQCPSTEAVLSGPQPEDENYYNKRQNDYDEALNNHIYVSRKDIMSRKLKKKKNRVSTTTMRPSPPTKDNRTILPENSKSFVEGFQRLRRDAAQVETTSNSTKNAHAVTVTNYEDMLNYQRDREEKALAQQDTGIKDFPILKPTPICSYRNASVQYQLENSCKAVESFNGTEISGQIHTTQLTNLQPEVTYRISIRACVTGVENGCGPELTILAETVSRRMETFLKNWTTFF